MSKDVRQKPNFLAGAQINGIDIAASSSIVGDAKVWRANRPLLYVNQVSDSIGQGSAGSRQITGITTVAGSNVIKSTGAMFVDEDVYRVLSHPNVPSGSVITGFLSSTVAFIDQNATASGTVLTMWILNPSACDRLRSALASTGVQTHLGFRGPWLGDFSALYQPTTSSQEYAHGGVWGTQTSTTVYDLGLWQQNNFVPSSVRSPVQITDGVITLTTTLTSATAAFTAADEGRLLLNTATGGAGNIAPGTYIKTYNSATNVTLSQPCTNGTVLTIRIETATVTWRRSYCPDKTPIAAFDIVWSDTNITNNFSYSIDGGVTWVAVTATNTVNPIAYIRSQRVNAVLTDTSGAGSTVILRGASTTGAFARFGFIGLTFYSTITPVGIVVSNMSMAGGVFDTGIHSQSLSDAATTNGSPTVTSLSANFQAWQRGQPINGPGIPASTYIGIINSPTSIGMSNSANNNTTPVNATATATNVRIIVGSMQNNAAILGNFESRSANAYPGLKSDLLILGPLSNDLPTWNDEDRYRLRLERAVGEVRQWGGDALIIGCYEQQEVAPSRTITDVTTTGTDSTLVSASGAFTAADIGSVVRGDFIPRPTLTTAVTIVSVQSTTQATLNGLNVTTGATTTGIINLERSVGGQIVFREAARQAAVNANAMYIDLYKDWKEKLGGFGWAVANAAGFMNDSYHPSPTANLDIGMRLFRALSNFIASSQINGVDFRPSRVLPLVNPGATPTVNCDQYDVVNITGQTANITSVTVTGTPKEDSKLRFSITGTATRTITWGSSFEASTVPLPTTTSGITRLDVGFFWNSATSKWRCVAVA